MGLFRVYGDDYNVWSPLEYVGPFANGVRVQDPMKMGGLSFCCVLCRRLVSSLARNEEWRLKTERMTPA
jgi:hypothetical protein